jgi:hypothetical protein
VASLKVSDVDPTGLLSERERESSAALSRPPDVRPISAAFAFRFLRARAAVFRRAGANAGLSAPPGPDSDRSSAGAEQSAPAPNARLRVARVEAEGRAFRGCRGPPCSRKPATRGSLVAALANQTRPGPGRDRRPGPWSSDPTGLVRCAPVLAHVGLWHLCCVRFIRVAGGGPGRPDRAGLAAPSAGPVPSGGFGRACLPWQARGSAAPALLQAVAGRDCLDDSDPSVAHASRRSHGDLDAAKPVQLEYKGFLSDTVQTTSECQRCCSKLSQLDCDSGILGCLHSHHGMDSLDIPFDKDHDVTVTVKTPILPHEESNPQRPAQ